MKWPRKPTDASRPRHTRRPTLQGRRGAEAQASASGRANRRLWRLVASALFLVTLVALFSWVRLGPLPPDFLTPAGDASTLIVDRNGETLYEARSGSGTRGRLLTADALPGALVAATLAAEDVRFFSHTGVDPIAIVRAAWRNVGAGKRVEGGSTITQQVVKLLQQRAAGHLQRRGWAGKLREAVLAERLEHARSKREILALYLNLAPYGNQIDGAERASLDYFGRSSASLTAAEAAFLAALPQQPTRFNPRRDPSRARDRQVAILRTEGDRGWLAPADVAAARAERLSLAAPATSALAPHFVEFVRAQMAADAAPDAPTPAPSPRRIVTTLDASLQRTIEGILSTHRAALDAHHAQNVAVVVLDNATGEWLAWEGSGAYGNEAVAGSIDGVTSPRQPGSALKPFTYAAALDRGFTAAMAIPDVPAQFPTAVAGVLYRPQNYDGAFRGPLLMRAALAGSENVPAVVMANEVGIPAIGQLLRQAGLTTLTNDAAHYGLGLTLGNAEVRLDQLVTAYAALARGGTWRAASAIRSVDGRPPAPSSPPRAIVSPRTAFLITSMLSDDDARAFAFGRGGSLEFPFSVAAKTGTSTSYRDNWTVGYTTDVTVGVWVGNFDRTPMHHSSGVTGAGPIFHDVMMAAVERARGRLPIDDYSPILSPTPDLVEVEICARSGLLATDACPTRATEWVPSDHRPPPCNWHRATPSGVVTQWPAIYRDWAAANDPSSILDAPAHNTSRTGLTITSPLAGATFLVDPTLRPDFQMLTFNASGATGDVQWFVDDRPLAGNRWSLAHGEHVVAATDANGHSARVRISVR